jgi:UDP-N-acetylmuramate dehydrogenase
MQAELNKNIKQFNTLGLDINVACSISPATEEELADIFKCGKYDNMPVLVMGGGSNILFTKNYDGLVIFPSMKGITIVGEEKDYIFIKVGSGIPWDDFVEYCNDRNWGGIENLSGIPGMTGASPVQNIGAYGSDVSGVILSVRYFDMKRGIFDELKTGECKFGYRNSIFKQELKNRAVITHVTFRLAKNPVINIGYADVTAALAGVETPGIRDVRRAILEIRNSKLPDPKITGNCGSFFKNPVIDADMAISLKAGYPDLKLYPETGGRYKLPAGWLIEKCGFKGYREGNVGVHSMQALVLLAYEGATGNELLDLAKKIRAAVSEKFGTDIEPEVNII